MAKRNNQQQHFHSHQNTSSRVMPKLEKCLADNDVHVLLSENKKTFFCNLEMHQVFTYKPMCLYARGYGTSALSDKQRTRTTSYLVGNIWFYSQRQQC